MPVIVNTKEIFEAKTKKNQLNHLSEYVDSIKTSMNSINSFRVSKGIRPTFKDLIVGKVFHDSEGYSFETTVGESDGLILEHINGLTSFLNHNNSLEQLQKINYSPSTKTHVSIPKKLIYKSDDKALIGKIVELSGFLSEEGFKKEIPLIIRSQKLIDISIIDKVEIVLLPNEI